MREHQRRPSTSRRLAASLLLSGSLLLSAAAAAADVTDSQPNPGLWGSSGLLTVPTTEILPNRNVYTSLSYFPLNSGLSLQATLALFEDLEAGLVFGVPPANGFASLAASLKYRIMNQAKGFPVSLALGANLIGLGDTPSYVPGSNVYLMLGRSFDWNQYRIVNLHGGFMGGLGGARAVAGLDVPILDFARVELEYLGNLNNLSHTLNLGVVVTPTPQLTLQAGLMQRPGSFWDRDFVLSVGWRGDWGSWFSQTPTALPGPSASPVTPMPTPTPVLRPPALEKGNVRIRVIDAERVIPLDGASISLSQPETATRFEGRSDLTGEARFDRIPIGIYSVVVQKDGWVLEQRRLSVQENLETFLEVPLSGKGGTIYGAIETADGGSPGDLDVEVQDVSHLLIRRVNLTGNSYRIEKLPPGAYALIVKSAGNERLRLNILVRANQESQYDLTLPPTGNPPSSLPSASPSAAPTGLPSSVPSSAPSSAPSPDATPSAMPSPSTAPTPAPTPPPAGPIIAQIEGVVKAKGGQPLSGVRLELKNDDLMVILLSNSEGHYVFREIPQGIFRLQLSKDGYKTRAYQITINKSEVMKHDFELESGQ